MWNINFKTLMDLLEKRVIETQDLLNIDGLPYLDGENQGVMWDTDQPFGMEGRSAIRPTTIICIWPGS